MGAMKKFLVLGCCLAVASCARFSLNRPCEDDTDCPEPLVCALRIENTLCLLPCERNTGCEEVLGDSCFVCGNQDGPIPFGSDDSIEDGFCGAGCN
jgi:hypothetical protein